MRNEPIQNVHQGNRTSGQGEKKQVRQRRDTAENRVAQPPPPPSISHTRRELRQRFTTFFSEVSSIFGSLKKTSPQKN